jgi:hypothetical protein
MFYGKNSKVNLIINLSIDLFFEKEMVALDRK